MTDYRALLIKYMAHILGEEGVTYLHRLTGNYDSGYRGDWGGDVVFTPVEMAELRQIEFEAKAIPGHVPMQDGPA